MYELASTILKQMGRVHEMNCWGVDVVRQQLMKEVEGVPGLVEQLLARKKDLDRVGKGSTIYSDLFSHGFYLYFEAPYEI